MLPYLLHEVSSTVEFMSQPAYRRFMQILCRMREPESLSEIVYHRHFLRNHPVPRVNLNHKRQRLTASFRIHLEMELIAKCGLATRLYPVRIAVDKIEGNYATKTWLHARVSVRLPSYLVPARAPGKSRICWPKLLRFTVAFAPEHYDEEFIVDRVKLGEMLV